MTLCAIDWCACLATNGDKCSVHAKNPDVKPEEGAQVDRQDCKSCEGTGDCKSCDGLGEHQTFCDQCDDYHEHDCPDCSGGGVCGECEED